MPLLVYINDLAEDLESVVHLCADDTIAYLTIASQPDATRLQRVLDRLAKWQNLWQMQFHPENAKSIECARSTRQTTVTPTYFMPNHSKL